MDDQNYLLKFSGSVTDAYLMFPWIDDAIYGWWYHDLAEIERQLIAVPDSVALSLFGFLRHYPVIHSLTGIGPTLSRLGPALFPHLPHDWPHPSDVQSLIGALFVRQVIDVLARDTVYSRLRQTACLSPVDVWALQEAVTALQLDHLPALTDADVTYPFALARDLETLIEGLGPLLDNLRWIKPVDGYFRIAASSWPVSTQTEPHGPFAHTVAPATTES